MLRRPGTAARGKYENQSRALRRVFLNRSVKKGHIEVITVMASGRVMTRAGRPTKDQSGRGGEGGFGGRGRLLAATSLVTSQVRALARNDTAIRMGCGATHTHTLTSTHERVHVQTHTSIHMHSQIHTAKAGKYHAIACQPQLNLRHWTGLFTLLRLFVSLSKKKKLLQVS